MLEDADMSRFRLHIKENKRDYRNWLALGIVGLLLIAGSVTIHSMGIVRAKSRETVLLYTEEEFEQYLLDLESEEYNLNGSYRLEGDLDLGWLYQSIGTNLEPFTGTFDGNGHVISGLTRPLFGVIKEAEVENLFLSDVMIENPFTYYDGEHYVDGYGSLAAYAVHSVIRNCGMNGEIHTAPPVEAEYLLEKASPSDADELKGPGVQEPTGDQAGTGESSTQTVGPGMETIETAVSGPAGGPGEETGGEWETSTDAELKTDGSVETEPAGETEMSSMNESNPALTEGTDNTSEEPSEEQGTVSESSGNVGEDGSDGTLESETPELAETSVTAETIQTESTNMAQPEVPEPPQPKVSEPPQPKVPEPTRPKVPESTQPKMPEPTQPKTTEVVHLELPETVKSETVRPDQWVAETAGYDAVNRQVLFMKLSSVTDINLEGPSEATASNATEEAPALATPSDAVNVEAGGDSGIESQEDDLHYIGNPNGDIYILVTADRVAAGGLIAQTAHKTLISNSFTLITISSFLEDVETYTGGLAAILGADGKTENSYATGLADSDGIIGGFAAVNDGEIENCYSTLIVGESGISRGAFTAFGNGSLTGCVYDRQMACVDAVNEEVNDAVNAEEHGMESNTASDAGNPAEFSLKAFNTAEMTGTECEIPGTWRKAEQAYPQLEYFARHDQQAVSDSSRTSAIALMLPGDLTLLDAIKDGDVKLPSEIDGVAITWETEGNIRIDEQNQVRAEECAVPSIKANDIPTVQSTVGPMVETPPIQADEGSAGTEDEHSEIVKATEQNTEETLGDSKIQLKASVGNATKNIALKVMASPKATERYADWNAVGAAVSNNTNGMGAYKPAAGDGSAEDPYLIGTPEALAWYFYQLSQNNQTSHVKLTADIDLFGTEYNGGIAYDESTNNITSALRWNGIVTFMGAFDGNHHVIRHIYMRGDNVGFIRNIGADKNRPGVLKNLGIESGLYQGTSARNGALAGCLYYGGIYNCWAGSGVVVSASGKDEAGGIVGGISGAGTRIVEGCYNLGSVTGAWATGGIVGQMWNVDSIILRNCYNMGDVSGTKNVGGIEGAIELANPKWIENCYNTGAISGPINAHSIFGGNRTNGSSITITNCYYDSNCEADGRATALSKRQMNSWAFAYALNNQGIKQKGELAEGLSWAYSPDKNNGYPYLSAEGLDRPESWMDIGEGIAGGLIKMNSAISGTGQESDTYLITNAEQLAWFAYQVNSGMMPDACARMGNNIDLKGIDFGGADEDPIYWKPIGTSTNPYTGIFDGNGKIIANMRVKEDGYAGLFGCVGGGAVIRKTGLDNTCTVEVASPGASAFDGTAAFVGAVKSVDGVATQLTIEHCYTRAEIRGKSRHTGAFLGNDESTSGENRISNCYTTGRINVPSGVKPGAIAGTFANGTGSAGSIQYCYWDEKMEDGYSGGLNLVGEGSQTAVDSGKRSTDDMKSDDFTANLNTGSGTAIWERDSNKNNGYPIFTGLDTYASWDGVGAAVPEPETVLSTNKGTKTNPYLLRSAEDLAWFAYQVNHGTDTAGLCGKLMADISLFGGLYTGGNGYDANDNEILSRALLWIPIGSDADGKRYTGTFDGNGYKISKVRMKGTEKQGLFGTLGNGGIVRKTAISTSLVDVSGQYAGGIAGYIFGSGVEVTECGIVGSLSGTGSYYGGCVGGVNAGSELLLDGCYNDAGGIILSKNGDYVGGVLGGAGSGNVTVRNCYNRGKVTGQAYVGGIAGSAGRTTDNCYNAGIVSGTGSTGGINGISTASVLNNCFYESGATVDAGATELESRKLLTWGAAWKLNGENLKQSTGISWNYDPEKHGGYPYPYSGSLQGAGSWEVVGKGVADGFFTIGTPTGNPYEIRTGSQLAWFAYQVNHVAGMSGIQGVLVHDIDMEAEGNFYTEKSHLAWIPIGKDSTSPYTGTFSSKNLADASDTSKIYQIRNLYSNTTGPAGLFGTLSGGTVSRIGISNGVITGGNAGGSAEEHARKNAGGIAGETTGAAVIDRCYNRSENGKTGKVTAANCAGGIVGKLGPGGTVQDCYSLETVITGTGSSACAGGIAGNGSAGVVRNSYSACGESGSITASAGGTAGAVSGIPGDGSGMSQCYSDRTALADRSFVKSLAATGNELLMTQTAGLNTVSGRERRKGDRIWYTSLASEATKGYPTLVPAVMLPSLGAVDPASGADGVVFDLSTAGFPASVMFRYASQETTGDETVSLTKWEAGNYFSYGSTNADKTIGLEVGTGTPGTTGIVLDPAAMSLELPTVDLGAASSLTLYTAAACIYPTAREILLELSSGMDRYEIRFTINGVTRKPLDITLTADVAMEELLPGGSTEKTAYSAPVTLANSHDYPMEGAIVKVKEISAEDREGYRALKPIAKDSPYGSGQIYDAGVKLGITNPAPETGAAGLLTGDLYYNRDAAPEETPWMKCQLKAKGSFQYRYFLKYQADPYYDRAHPNFGYIISYQFGVMKDDYTETADAVLSQ